MVVAFLSAGNGVILAVTVNQGNAAFGRLCGGGGRWEGNGGGEGR